MNFDTLLDFVKNQDSDFTEQAASFLDGKCPLQQGSFLCQYADGVWAVLEFTWDLTFGDVVLEYDGRGYQGITTWEDVENILDDKISHKFFLGDS